MAEPTGAAPVKADAGEVTLRRALTLPWLTLYGLGTILGAGIYALVGKVAGPAGGAAPLAFVLSAVVAGFTALSYAELAARHPVSAGEAVWVGRAFGVRWLEALVGWAVATSGVVSSATVTHGFVGYLRELVDVPQVPAIVVTVGVLAVVAGYGIRESVWLAGATTVVEIFGLLLVIALAGGALAQLP